MQILGQTFQIVLRSPKKDSYGECKALERVIELNNNLAEEEMRRVACHEAYHAAIIISGLDELLTPKQHEALCVLMESVAEDIIKVWGASWGK